MSGKITNITATAYNVGNVHTEMNIIFDEYINPRELWDCDMSELFPGKVIIKCRHCGQFAARKTACIHCGAPVE